MGKFTPSFSQKNLELDEIIKHHDDVETALNLYFVFSLTSSTPRFLGYTKSELELELEQARIENDLSSSMNLLAALEATFRMDYQWRCGKKLKDPLSIAIRGIYEEKNDRASLENDILEAWKKYGPIPNQLISSLKGAFKYRHWLAHGRYWVPKLGQNYDFYNIATLAQGIWSYDFEH